MLVRPQESPASAAPPCRSRPALPWTHRRRNEYRWGARTHTTTITITTDAEADLSIPDAELSRPSSAAAACCAGAGLLGAGAAAASVLSRGGPGRRRHGDERGYVGGLRWLAGDHHIHTQYSGDGMYRVIDQARHAAAYGLDWMVITDHGGATHARIGVGPGQPGHRGGPLGAARHC